MSGGAERDPELEFMTAKRPSVVSAVVWASLTPDQRRDWWRAYRLLTSSNSEQPKPVPVPKPKRKG